MDAQIVWLNRVGVLKRINVGNNTGNGGLHASDLLRREKTLTPGMKRALVDGVNNVLILSK